MTPLPKSGLITGNKGAMALPPAPRTAESTQKLPSKTESTTNLTSNPPRNSCPEPEKTRQKMNWLQVDPREGRWLATRWAYSCGNFPSFVCRCDHFPVSLLVRFSVPVHWVFRVLGDHRFSDPPHMQKVASLVADYILPLFNLSFNAASTCRAAQGSGISPRGRISVFIHSYF